MEDLITRIRAAIDEDEAWARAACQAYPYATDKTLPPQGVSWEWVAGEDWEPVTPDPMVDEFVAPAGHNCWLATKETWPDERGQQRRHTYTNDVVELDAAAGGHIIRHDPKRVLRQVTAYRTILDLAEKAIEEYTEDPCNGARQVERAWASDVLGALADVYGIEHQ